MSLGETAVGQALASGAWTITLLAILSVLYVIFMGLGYWLYSVVIPRSVNTRWQYLFWLGLIALVGTLQILHFFSAVNWEMRLMFGLIGCAGFVQLVRKGWLPASSRRGFLILAMLMPMALFIANQALGDPKHGDSGLYHFQAIQWITSFHVGPGLGNLHEWLGFNQSYFLYAAVLKIGPSVLQEYHLANGLLLLALAIELFRGMSQLFDDGLVIGALIRLLLIVPLAYYSTSVVNVSSPTPDAAVFVLGILIFIYLADFVSTNYDQKDLPEVLIIMLLATLLITFKLTLIVFAAGTLVTVAGIFLRHEMKVGLPQLFALGKGFALSCVLLIPWILRGIVTSGYPLFPSAAFGLPVDWRVPYALVRNSGNVVRSWARLPEGDPEVVLGNWEWLQPWSRSFLDEHTIVLYLIGIGLFLSVVLYLAGAKRLPPMGKWVTPIPVLIAAIGFWFWAAPSFRFIEPVMLSLLAWFWAPP